MTITEMSFAQNLKKLMKERGVTSRVVCQATGIPTSTFSEWTSGRDPKLSESVLKLAKFFGVTIEHLITGKIEETVTESSLIEQLANDFTTLHSGVYRIKIEKMKKEKS